MRKLNVGIIGCGVIAMQKHFPALMKLGEKVEVDAFCSGNKQNAKSLLKLLIKMERFTRIIGSC
ncbi:hypothetical protein E1I69_07570 [Bacillus timonensis]|uniref:Gfo/Idh/MocA-like oxidoreductase N-terminal domain-containing protein n=1 Tax=Bacillus timonensis TaxID=1033734 RepID=A0A4S3PVC4_9BACI|nr:hypothetical protein [Bacillus timonensis]THE13464.1 hypothetical protein E1I69_07570 [Bacillus timonensis]